MVVVPGFFIRVLPPHALPVALQPAFLAGFRLDDIFRQIQLSLQFRIVDLIVHVLRPFR